MGRKKLSNEEYRDNLKERYSESFVEDFDSIFEGDITLSQISSKHKLSKMRASQIFKRLFGKTFREVKHDGKSEDIDGVTKIFEPGRTRQFVVILPEELYVTLKSYCSSNSMPMAAVARDCISDFFNKDGLSKASKYF